MLNGYLLILIVLVGCKTETKIATSYPLPTSMSDGEIVSYSFTYEGIKKSPSVHTITKVSDGEPSGEIIYTIEGQTEENYRLDDIDVANLNEEQSFLIYGSRLPQDTALNSTDPVTLVSGEDVTITIADHTFQAYKSVYTKDDITMTIYSYNGVDEYPLRGQLKYEWSDGTNSVTVELIEWNDL